MSPTTSSEELDPTKHVFLFELIRSSLDFLMWLILVACLFLVRLTDLGSSNKFLDGLTQVSHLTQEEPVEPLALSRPTLEESGIDKEEIVSSGAPQVSKDGSFGQSSNDFAQSIRIKHGSRDDVSIPLDEANDKADHAKAASSKSSEYLPHEKQYTSCFNFMIDAMKITRCLLRLNIEFQARSC